jgi:hypothetical protein
VDARLTQWRVASEQSIVENTDELLLIARDLVEDRLASVLGVHEQLERRVALRRAIVEVERVRAQILETLGDDLLA